MELHPIQNFKAMSTKQKVATVAAATLSTAAIASVPLAYVKGKGAREEKALEAIKQGYKKIGGTIVEQFNKIKNNISKQEAPKQTPAEVPAAPTKLEEKAQEVVEQAATKVEEKAAQKVDPRIEAGAMKKAEAILNGTDPKLASAVSNASANVIKTGTNKKIIINAMEMI